MMSFAWVRIPLCAPSFLQEVFKNYEHFMHNSWFLCYMAYLMTKIWCHQGLVNSVLQAGIVHLKLL